MANNYLTEAQKQQKVEELYADFLNNSPTLQDDISKEFVNKAFAVARKAHAGQYRKTGLQMPYIVHPIAVAQIISQEMGFGRTTAAAALLHDTVEDSDYTYEDIVQLFNKEIADIVDGVTKIKEGFNPNSSIQVQTFKKFINYLAEDRRVAFVKIADRLHNLRTFEGIKENSQMIKTAEAYDIYAPLAHMLGLYEIKKEIEDLSFKYREPELYKEMTEKVEKYAPERTEFLNSVKEKIKAGISQDHISYRLETTQRSLYRAYRISTQKKIKFKDIHNFNSLRLIISPRKGRTEKQECYCAYASLTDLFPTRQHTFKDWVTHPKSNGFQALIVDIYFRNKWQEVQILTEPMNIIAQRGFASGYANKHTDNIYLWASSIKNILNTESLTDKEVLELIRPQHQEIYVISPKGEMILLPKNATVLDYAFEIHTKLGLHFAAAEVNGQTVSYDHKLDTADQVKIISSEEVLPKRYWIDSLAGQKNKNILKAYFRKQKQNIINEGALRYEEIAKENQISKEQMSFVISKLNCKNKNEFYYRVAKGRIKKKDILKNRKKTFWHKIKKITPLNKQSSALPKKAPEETFQAKEPFILTNPDLIIWGRCCYPINGDRAIIHRNGKTLAVHRSNCKQAMILNSTDGKNTANVKWDMPEKRQFFSEIHFSGIDQKGVLLEVVKIISKKHEINMQSLDIKSKKNTFSAKMFLLVESVDALNKLLKEMRKIKQIRKAYRYMSGE